MHRKICSRGLATWMQGAGIASRELSSAQMEFRIIFSVWKSLAYSCDRLCMSARPLNPYHSPCGAGTVGAHFKQVGEFQGHRDVNSRKLDPGFLNVKMNHVAAQIRPG